MKSGSIFRKSDSLLPRLLSEGFGQLENLQNLNLQDCENLKTLPESKLLNPSLTSVVRFYHT